MKIIKVRKDDRGEITDVMLDNGQEMTINEAVQLASNKQIENVNVAHSKKGQVYLRSYPNGNIEDNLDSLPTF